jgi:alpha-amylase
MRSACVAIWLVVQAACSGARPPPAVVPPAAQARPPAAAVRAPGAGGPLRWADGAVFYEVFVRSFQDARGDGTGDLEGLISRLDYLNDGNPATDTDLGVDALWLMPVFASPSYHGYDTIDYETIQPDYGTNADFARLVTEAHRRGIRIIVDLVVNHTSAKHPWFVESASSPSSARRDWYVWSLIDPAWPQPWNANGRSWHPSHGAWFYGLFWEGMPDLNFRTPAVRDEVKRIAALWIARGVDGFRLDAAPLLVESGPGRGQANTAETHQFWKELAASVRAQKPDALLVGEVWDETPIVGTYYGSTDQIAGGDELPLTFDFALAERILEGIKAGEARGIVDKLREVQAVYPPGATDAVFLTNHDNVRLATALANDAGKLRSAAAVLLTLPGTPFLYYGEEVGLENGDGHGDGGDADPAKRTPMPWDATPGGGFTTGQPWHAFAPGRAHANVAAQTTDAGSLLSHYRRLIRARHASPALAHGSLELLTERGPVLAFVRRAGDDRVLVMINLGGQPERVSLELGARRAEPIDVTTGATLELTGTAAHASLPPHASGVFQLR